jgi:hypothetical protein
VIASSFLGILALSCAKVETAVSQATKKSKQAGRNDFIRIDRVIKGFRRWLSSVSKSTGIYCRRRERVNPINVETVTHPKRNSPGFNLTGCNELWLVCLYRSWNPCSGTGSPKLRMC